jgi:glycosyltransferase involved in cell wall biosynthesis
VLLVVRELGLGGIERDVTKLALGFDRSRFTPYVATYKPFGPRYDELFAAGIPILHLDFPSLLSKRAVTAAQKFRAWVKRHKIEIVHAFDPSSVFAVPLARLLRVPVVLSSQLGHRELHDPRTRKQLRLVDRLSDVVVVNCEALRRHLSTQHDVPVEKIELCYNGVDARQFHPSPIARIQEVSGASLVIGTVCVLRPEKGLELLLTAFAQIRNLVPGVRLLIVGNGPELPKLQARSEELKLKGAVVFKPAVSSVAPVMHSMDIFVSCSYSEAFSNAILEAQACGCCVIASRVGGTPELIGENTRGLLFTSGDANDLAAKLSSVIQNAELRNALGRSAATFAASELSVEKNVARTSQIYEGLLARKPARQKK